MVLEERNIPHGVEFLIKIQDGRAVVKFFGPNSKEEYSLVVNKSKKNDVEFVEKLTKSVIKPLLDKHISGEGWKTLISKDKVPDDDKKAF